MVSLLSMRTGCSERLLLSNLAIILRRFVGWWLAMPYVGLLIWFVDRSVPEEVQEDSWNYRVGSSYRHRRCLLWKERYLERNRYRCAWFHLHPIPLPSEKFTWVLLVVANEGQRIDIPDGCVLENSESAHAFLRPTVTDVGNDLGLLSGNLTMTVSFPFYWLPRVKLTDIWIAIGTLKFPLHAYRMLLWQCSRVLRYRSLGLLIPPSLHPMDDHLRDRYTLRAVVVA